MHTPTGECEGGRSGGRPLRLFRRRAVGTRVPCVPHMFLGKMEQEQEQDHDGSFCCSFVGKAAVDGWCSAGTHSRCSTTAHPPTFHAMALPFLSHDPITDPVFHAPGTEHTREQAQSTQEALRGSSLKLRRSHLTGRFRFFGPTVLLQAEDAALFIQNGR